MSRSLCARLGFVLGITLLVYLNVVVVPRLSFKHEIVAYPGGVISTRISPAVSLPKPVHVIDVADHPERRPPLLKRLYQFGAIPFQGARQLDSCGWHQQGGRDLFICAVRRSVWQGIASVSPDEGDGRGQNIGRRPSVILDRELNRGRHIRHKRDAVLVRNIDIRPFNDLVRGQRFFQDAGLSISSSPLLYRDYNKANGQSDHRKGSGRLNSTEYGFPPISRRAVLLILGWSVWGVSLWVGGLLIYRDDNILRGACVLLVGCAAAAASLLLWYLTLFRWSWGWWL